MATNPAEMDTPRLIILGPSLSFYEFDAFSSSENGWRDFLE